MIGFPLQLPIEATAERRSTLVIHKDDIHRSYLVIELNNKSEATACAAWQNRIASAGSVAT